MPLPTPPSGKSLTMMKKRRRSSRYQRARRSKMFRRMKMSLTIGRMLISMTWLTRWPRRISRTQSKASPSRETKRKRKKRRRNRKRMLFPKRQRVKLFIRRHKLKNPKHQSLTPSSQE
jgi:hypothetical protein